MSEIEQRDVDPVSRIRTAFVHREVVAAWADYMVRQGYEIQVTGSGEGKDSTVEGLAW